MTKKHSGITMLAFIRSKKDRNLRKKLKKRTKEKLKLKKWC